MLLCLTSPADAQSIADANKRFDSALKRDPKSLEALYGRGVSRVQSFNSAGAIEDLTKVIQARPREPYARYYRGTAYGQLDKFKEAAEDFSVTLGTNEPLPDDLRYYAYVYRGLNRNELGQLDGTRQDMDAAIELNASLPAAWAGRQRVRRAQGDEAGAQSDSKRAGEIDPALGTSLEAYRGIQVSQVILWVVIAVMGVFVAVGVVPLVKSLILLTRADKNK